MSAYLEQNARRLAEVGANVRLQRGKRIDTGGKIFFSLAGSYRSPELGIQVFAGVKEYLSRDPRSKPSEYQIRARLIEELAAAKVIADIMPHLLLQLPLFYGLLLDKDGDAIAIVAEDFSKGGRQKVEADPHYPKDIETALNQHNIPNRGKYTIENMTFMAGGERRIGDLDNVLIPTEEVLVHREEIEDNLDKYTIKIDHDL